MSCNKECNNHSDCHTETDYCQNQGNGYLCIVVLYILLAIILGSLIIR